MAAGKTISRDKLVAYLDEYLNVATIPDDSPNGLQVQGSGRVGKLALAVDASATTIGAAVRSKADLIIVHHGLFWGRHQQIVGSLHKRISLLTKNDVSLYAAHLPLDCHPELGNNVELARLFGMEVTGSFAEYKGTKIGTLARVPRPMPREKLKHLVEKALECPADLLPFGPATVRRIGIVSGGAASFAEEARRLRCDALVTGESSHAGYSLARDAGINLIYGGHYATETVGLRALERHIKATFGIATRFVSAPTGY